MKISKSALRRIIKEERQKILVEMFGNNPADVPNDLITFAQMYNKLGDAVSSQVDDIVMAFVNAGPNSDEFMETVYEVNPNAIDYGLRYLGNLNLGDCQESYDDVIEALRAAERIFALGDEEVKADARAAGDKI